MGNILRLRCCLVNGLYSRFIKIALHKQLSFVWDEAHSLDTAWLALDRPLYMAFYDMHNFLWGFPRICSSALHIRKSYNG